MRIFKSTSIKQKIVFITLFVTISSVSLIFTIDVFLNLGRFKNDLQNSRTLTTRLIAQNSISTLVFEDSKGAVDILNSLKEIPDVEAAFIYDANGVEFAAYYTGDSIKHKPGLGASGSRFEEKFLYINEPVIYQDYRLGTVNIIVSTINLKLQNRNYIATTLTLFFVILTVAVFLALWLQKIVTKPVLKLAHFADEISHSKDFSLRVKKTTDDEIGVLYDRFNVMLGQIEKRQSERNMAKKELENEREHLELRVIERTEELKSAMEKAEESDRLKTAFLANISHEIRTPMNAILGFSELLKDDNLPLPLKKEYIEIIHSSGNHLLSIINDIVEISKIETGQVQCSRDSVDILNLSETIFRELSIIHDPSKISFNFRKPVEDMPLVTTCDKTKLTQVLINLITNAFKYTEKGIVEFGYELVGTDIKFYVKDTGAGIDKKYHASIFDRFRRIEDQNRKFISGFGLGLAISKAYIELMGGEIFVESEPRKGSVFFFTIPYILTAPQPTDIARNYDFKDKMEMEQKILIAEDDDLNFKYLEIILSRLNVNIVRAMDGQEAVDKIFSDDSITLVLMDLKMPVLNGYEATRMIKEKKPTMPIIATTAYALSGDKEKAFEAGCDEYISKPISRKDLFQKIEFVNKMYAK